MTAGGAGLAALLGGRATPGVAAAAATAASLAAAAASAAWVAPHRHRNPVIASARAPAVAAPQQGVGPLG